MLRHDEESIKTWNDVVDFYNSIKDEEKEWIFRGQEKGGWGFMTSLERAILDVADDKLLQHSRKELAKEHDEDKLHDMKLTNLRAVLKGGFEYKEGGELKRRSVFELEEGLIRRFQRQCHHYMIHIPKRHNIPEWLALMQHHGAPTSLLDWTYSFFVALYFAIESAEEKCAVWALNSDWVVDRLRQELIDEKENDLLYLLDTDINLEKLGSFKRVFRREKDAFSVICPINPYRLNQRLVIQQGVFLCSGNLAIPLEDNLEALQCKVAHAEAKQNLIKVKIEDSLYAKREFLQNLHRMNMNRATLFPGLDGFAQSLRTLMVYPKILKPWEQEILRQKKTK